MKFQQPYDQDLLKYQQPWNQELIEVSTALQPGLGEISTALRPGLIEISTALQQNLLKFQRSAGWKPSNRRQGRQTIPWVEEIPTENIILSFPWKQKEGKRPRLPLKIKDKLKELYEQ